MSIAVVAGMVASTGCAFGTRHAELTYPPKEPNGLIESAHADDRAIPRSQEVILTVSDKRVERDRIGNVRNSIGMDTADVVTDVDVVAWVEAALTYELTAAGYNVVAPGTDGTRDDAVGLTAEVVEVHCDVYLTYDADVALLVTLEADGSKPVRKQIEGDGSVGMNWAATGTSYAESLGLALQEAIGIVLTETEAFGDRGD